MQCWDHLLRYFRQDDMHQPFDQKETSHTDLMHQCTSHLHSSALQQFYNGSGKSTTICTSCSLKNSHRHQFMSSTLPKSDTIMYLVHSDIVGPFQTTTPGGKQYFFTFINENSRFVRIYLLARKDKVFQTFFTYLTESERHTGHQLCILKSDYGGRYSSTQFKVYAATHGIKLEQAPVNTPQKNSVADRYNQTIMEYTRAQMIHASIPKYLWGEIVSATSHILIISPTLFVNNLPMNIW